MWLCMVKENLKRNNYLEAPNRISEGLTTTRTEEEVCHHVVGGLFDFFSPSFMGLVLVDETKGDPASGSTFTFTLPIKT